MTNATARPSQRDHHAPPVADDVTELALRWQRDHDEAARDELFERFLPLARRLAGRYSNPYEPLEDLVQVASMGLLGAVDRFDPCKGGGFRAFAVPTILGELKRYFRNTGWSVHVPRGAQELALRVERASRTIAGERGRPPRVDELAQFLELPVEDVIAGLEAGSAHYSVSLDAPVGGADGEEPQALGESLGDDDERFGLVETKLALSAAIARLPYLERRALTLRIDKEMKQTEIARELGCSQMQVSRLLRRAARRLHEFTDSPPEDPGRPSQ